MGHRHKVVLADRKWQAAGAVAAAGVDVLIDDIAGQWRTAGGWSVGADTLQRAFGLSPQEFYQSVYAADLAGNRMVTLSSANERIDADSVGLLAAMVEHIAGGQAVAALVDAGIFHPHEQQADLMAVLLAHVASLINCHRFRADEYRAMLLDRNHVGRARATYLRQYFDLDAARRQAATDYAGGRAYTHPNLALDMVERLLRLFFARNLLTEELLYSRLYPHFASVEREESFARAGAAEADEPSPSGGRLDGARAIMGLHRARFTLGELRSRYKQLIKRFHPDVNPRGLRRCQEINGAYSLLLAEVAAA